MTRPAIVITGASGFIGRHLLEEFKNEYRIFAIARRSQRECGALVHPNIAWMQVDIGDREGLTKTFREISSAGGAKYLFHLAAYYDFDGYEKQEYRRTNVEGTRNVLDLAKTLHFSRVFFSSSVAACAFPEKNSALTESSPPNGDHIYSWSKKLGEEMVIRHSLLTPVCIVRFGAAFSDWCEYPPLYMFLDTWLGTSWKARILAGNGDSAIPYIHIRDLVSFFRHLLQHECDLGSSDVLIASTSGSTSHLQLFEQANLSFYGRHKPPLKVPKFLVGLGLITSNAWGKLNGNPPFEKPWMRRYIDLQLNIDNSLTRRRLGWTPEARLRIEKRLPFLIERLKSEPQEWLARNLAAMRRVTFRPELLIYESLSRAEDEIVKQLLESMHSISNRNTFPHWGALEESESRWFVRLIYRLALTSIQSGHRLLLSNYFRVTAQSRFEVGFTGDEIANFLRLLHDSVLKRLRYVDQLKEYSQQVFDCITMPVELATDETLEAYRLYKQGELTTPENIETVSARTQSPREQLEETIWQCLVQKK